MSKEKYDQIFDAKIKAAGLKYLERIADEVSPEELVEFSVPTEDLDKRVKSSLTKHTKKRGVYRAFSIVAAAIILLVGISCVTITSTEALRIKFNQIFINEATACVNVEAPSERDTDIMPEGSDFINPGYLPEGSVLCEAKITSVNIINTYINKENSIIRISKSQDAGNSSFDNENSVHYETQIKGNRAIVIEYDDNSMLYYFSNNFFYHLVGEGVDVDELLEIAKNLPK